MKRTLLAYLCEVATYIDGWDVLVPHHRTLTPCGLRSQGLLKIVHDATGAIVAVSTIGYHTHPTEDSPDMLPPRLEFYPAWPSTDNDYYQPTRSQNRWKRITISTSRLPVSTAKDITRRLLDGYPEAYALQAQIRDAWLAHKASAEGRAAEWATRLGGRISSYAQTHVHFHAGSTSLELEFSYDGSLSIPRHGSLDPDMASAVLEAIAAVLEARAATTA